MMVGYFKTQTVLHVITSLDFGGVESHMRLIAVNAKLSRWSHKFCAIGGGGAVAEEIKATGAQVVVLGRRVHIPTAAAIGSLWKCIRQIKPDVVHLHGAEANFHGAIAARMARVPVVIGEEIGIPRHSLKARKVFGWVYRRCDHVLAISQAVKEGIIELGEAKPFEIKVIYNPFQPQTYHTIPPRNGKLVLGFVGRLEAVKNPMAAVEAVGILRDRGFDPLLRIIGEGSQRSTLEKKIATLHLEDNVELVGFHSQPFSILQDSHFYLQPSLSEGFGLAICEAMSAGIPVIASAVGGAPEIIEHERTGWLLPSPEAVVLADMIEMANQHDDFHLASIGRRASLSVLDRFGVEAYLKHCDELYTRTCLEKARG